MEYLDKLLTKNQYDIYMMKLAGYKNAEIGEKLGCSRQNVGQSLLASKKKIEKYNSFISDGLKEEEAIQKFYRKSGGQKGMGGKRERNGKLINYMGKDKTLNEWCKELGINYVTAYNRYKKGLPPEKVFEKKRMGRIDYTIKDEYDLSLISDEYKEILIRKNNGESFAQIARDLGVTAPNIQTKAKAAICKLNGKKADAAIRAKEKHDRLKNDEKYMEKKREDSRRWYRNHLEEERARSRNKGKKNKKEEEITQEQEERKARTRMDYSLKKEYDLSLITDEYLHILQEKNKGKSFENIALELGQSRVNVRAKAKSAIDILQGKKPSNKFCLNCGKELEDTSHNIKYCDDCKNGKIYMPGHEGEIYGELKVDAVYQHKGYLYAECTCSCGKKREISYASLKSGITKSCGHINAKDLTGKVNKNGIKALYQTGEKKRECYIWRCLCTCGQEFDVISTHFPNVKSCGHLFEESRKKGMMRAREENEKYWIDGTSAIALTSKIGKNNTSGYKGVKWVKAEQRWYAEITFKGKLYYLGRYFNIEDAAEVRKIAEEHTHKDFLRWFAEEYPLLYKKISDRVEKNGADDIRRMREIREKNRKLKMWILEYKGEEKTLTEWCKELDMSYHCVRQRINAGWSVEKAFETPVRKRNNETK